MGKDEIIPSFVYRQHIGRDLSRHSQCYPVPAAFFKLPLMDHRQLGIPVGGKLGRLNKHGLKMFVALLGNRPPDFLPCRLSLSAAQAAVADGPAAA